MIHTLTIDQTERYFFADVETWVWLAYGTVDDGTCLMGMADTRENAITDMGANAAIAFGEAVTIIDPETPAFMGNELDLPELSAFEFIANLGDGPLSTDHDFLL